MLESHGHDHNPVYSQDYTLMLFCASYRTEQANKQTNSQPEYNYIALKGIATFRNLHFHDKTNRMHTIPRPVKTNERRKAYV